MMSKLLNRLFFVFLVAFMATGMTVSAQSLESSKLSLTTQMFLDEMQGQITFDAPVPDGMFMSPGQRPQDDWRPIARPEMIDGKAYIAAFVNVIDADAISRLEALGVKVQCKFKGNTLLTTMIPVDMIEAVAAIDGVTRVNVSPVMRDESAVSRQASNVDDVLTLSQDARDAGLLKRYDGKGVVLGVIDRGIDFHHVAFEDKNGNTRIKRAFVYAGGSGQEYSTLSDVTTDNVNIDHGTHTSAIAGGSSVVVNGSDVTVTDDHAQATYGGMAPGADLYLAGVGSLNATVICNAFQSMANYAAACNQPLVVSNSWSWIYGPHDGTSDFSDVIAEYFGDDHPNNICVFATGNDANKAGSPEAGGYYFSGLASSESPVGSIMCCNYRPEWGRGYRYYGYLADAWCRSASVEGVTCRVSVLDNATGEVLTSTTLTPTANRTTVTGLGDYYSGTLYIYKNYVASDKVELMFFSSNLMSKSYDDELNSAYTLALEFYPTEGSAVIDVWGAASCYFSDYLTTDGHMWTNGTDDMSVGTLATDPNVIAVGSYVSRAEAGSNSVGDISDFSSYAVEGAGPLGNMLPWITAPGQVVVSAVNHYVERDYTPTVDNPESPYDEMSGTSMATPAVAGIIALWMQAATECGKMLSHSDVKDIMARTAICDSWVNYGPNASHFGNGKIDALAGVKFILDNYGGSVGTDITEVAVGVSKTVVAVSYVNPLGETCSEPFKGVNIVVTRYSDGTMSTAKVLN